MPFTMISNSSDDLSAMERAAKNPQLLVVSDWSNFTSWEYIQGLVASELDILYV